GINHYSIWDKKHKPICNPEGMVFIPKLKVWIDIYLCNSEWVNNGTSKAGLNILAGSNNRGRVNPKGNDNFLYSDFQTLLKTENKRLITWDEFIISMKGVKEFSNANDLDNGITKHIRDFTSKYGIEQATGVQWVWAADKIDDERAVLLGGYSDGCVNAGSRTSGWSGYVWSSYWSVGCRAACDHL
ncbi:MAG: hypothetical protein PF437_11135, partial [Sulfurimonas sp.]|nr:hypothetical protein [Sulfurimonas sp.]